MPCSAGLSNWPMQSTRNVARGMSRPRFAAAALVAGIVLGACGDNGDYGRAATESMVLETCAPSGDPLEVEVCRCAYEAVTQNYDDAELERLDRRLRDEPDQLPADVQQAILDCTFDLLEPPPQPAGQTTTTPPSQDEG